MVEMRIHMELCKIWMELVEYLDEYRQEPRDNQNMVMQARLRQIGVLPQAYRSILGERRMSGS